MSFIFPCLFLPLKFWLGGGWVNRNSSVLYVCLGPGIVYSVKTHSGFQWTLSASQSTRDSVIWIFVRVWWKWNWNPEYSSPLATIKRLRTPDGIWTISSAIKKRREIFAFYVSIQQTRNQFALNALQINVTFYIIVAFETLSQYSSVRTNKSSILTYAKHYITQEPGRWHNGRASTFCTSDHSFESEPSPTSADACGEVTGCTASCQEVGTCSTRSESQGTYKVCLR